MIYAYAQLAKENEDFRKNTILIMHTNPIDERAYDLLACRNEYVPEGVNVIFSINGALPPEEIPNLYSLADWTIVNSDAEGFGLSSLESMMCGTPVIHTITGGLQDQVPYKFNQWDSNEYKSANLLAQECRYDNRDISSLYEENYAEHPWSIPLHPDASNVIGSIVTPYIFEDRVSFLQVKKALLTAFNDKDCIYQKNLLSYGIDWLKNNNFTATAMASAIAEKIKEVKNKPVIREKLSIYEY